MEFEELYERRNHIVREEKEKSGRPVLGTLCSYAPAEMIHSFDIIPVRIWGQAGDVQAADALMQPYICPPVRHLMALGIEGHYDFLDGIVHTYSCDATCGLYNIWVRNMRPGFSHLISLPYMDIPESREYALAELGDFVAKLEQFTARKFSPERLESSFAVYEEARSLIAEAYRLKAEGVPISYADMHYLNLWPQVLPLETALPRMRDFLEAAKAMEPRAAAGPRILLSGSVIPDTALMEFIEERGGPIVADDTCLGYRLVKDAGGGEGLEEGDPIAALAGYYLGRTPCASRADFPARKEYLQQVLERFGIDAVVFVHQKFCDPHLSDHPFLKEVLDGAGVPSLQLELEGESFNSQIQTRMEGFFEMIGAR